jgi:chaperone required for assembly of F1-ATPase
MLLTHAALLSEARSYIAALADNAKTVEASCAYDLALIELDWIHGDDGPAIDVTRRTAHRDVLMACATSAVERLTTYGVDALHTELLLASLEDARTLDMP